MINDQLTILRFENISKEFVSGDSHIFALRNITLEILAGRSVSLQGPSGSGKSTLLNIIAGLDTPTKGKVFVLNNDLSLLNQNELADFRGTNIGFIFQSFRLLGSLTAIENIEVPAKLIGINNARKIADDLLKRVGLGDRKNHYPSQLSGGEQQRVAIARAFSANPKIIIADEPTGNLDFETAHIVQNLMFELQKKNDTTLLIATHDREFASKTDSQISLKGGEII